jgi:hypothetical protein
MLHLRVGLVVAALGLMVACGDDDGAGSSTSDAAVGAAGMGNKAGSGGVMLRDAGMNGATADAGGSTMPGTIQEGMPCDIANPCAPELACVGIAIPNQNFSVCARPCGQGAGAATACEEDEVCGGYTNLPKDQHCLNQVDKEWEFCGPAETADCAAPLVCIRIPDDETTPEFEVIAICIQECAPAADADAGLEMSTCPNGQVCLPSGLCASLVERGGECSLGHFCEDETDQCLPDSLDDINNATYRCQQDCTAPNTVCEAGECVNIQDSSTGEVFNFCLAEQN